MKPGPKPNPEAALAHYRAYQREYARKRRAEKRGSDNARPISKDYNDLNPQEDMSWNPRILEHGPNYDDPKCFNH